MKVEIFLEENEDMDEGPAHRGQAYAQEYMA
jgi:hypothetical protein